MIPITQTITDPGRGNCLASCVASILEKPLCEVPNFAEIADVEGFQQAFVDYLASVEIIPLKIYIEHTDDPGLYIQNWNDHVILSGKSPRGKVSHAVVGKIQSGWGFEIVHDPHPDKTGLDGAIEWVTFLVGFPRVPIK